MVILVGLKETLVFEGLGLRNPANFNYPIVL